MNIFSVSCQFFVACTLIFLHEYEALMVLLRYLPSVAHTCVLKGVQHQIMEMTNVPYYLVEIKRHNCIFICYFSTTDSAMDLSIHSTDRWLIFHSHGWGQLNSPSANLPERWQVQKRDAFWSLCEHSGWRMKGGYLMPPLKPQVRDWTNLNFLLIVADSSWCLELWLK